MHRTAFTCGDGSRPRGSLNAANRARIPRACLLHALAGGIDVARGIEGSRLWTLRHDLPLVADAGVGVTGTPAQERPDWTKPAETTIYQVRGTGARLTGRYELQPEQRYQPVGYIAPPPIEKASFSFFDARSDFDGDGSSDLLVVDLNDVAPDIHGAVYLLPGSSREPD